MSAVGRPGIWVECCCIQKTFEFLTPLALVTLHAGTLLGFLRGSIPSAARDRLLLAGTFLARLNHGHAETQ